MKRGLWRAEKIIWEVNSGKKKESEKDERDKNAQDYLGFCGFFIRARDSHLIKLSYFESFSKGHIKIKG